MGETKKLNSRLNVLMPFELRREYKIFCAINNFGISDRVRKLIEQDMIKFKKRKKNVQKN